MAKSKRSKQLRRPVRPKLELPKILKDAWNPATTTPRESDYYWICAETIEGIQTLHYVFWDGVSFKASGINGRITHWRDVNYPKFPKGVNEK